ncbi:hypothetical protein AAG570_002682 [Ranatra chinensis]|uniref:Uncharacterized protein n=1 Tax=Ranatra chinensis TaxID=642074 RepID=A0ABD0Y8N8_9HEMI
MASKRRNMFHKNKTQETTEEVVLRGADHRLFGGESRSEIDLMGVIEGVVILSLVLTILVVLSVVELTGDMVRLLDWLDMVRLLVWLDMVAELLVVMMVGQVMVRMALVERRSKVDRRMLTPSQGQNRDDYDKRP